MRWKRCFVGVALFALIVSASFWAKRPPISFKNFDQIKACLDGHGYHFTSDTLNASRSMGVLISRNTQDPGQLGSLCKIGPMGDDWKGKIWVTLSPEDWALACIPDHAESRCWGDFIAFGDSELLTEVDEALQSSARP